MKKTMILLIAAAGLVSFASSFGVSYFLKKKAAQQNITDAKNAASATVQTTPDKPTEGKFQTLSADASSQTDTLEYTARSMSERQLQNLIFDLREKIQEYQNRQKELDLQAQQLDIAKQTLQSDIEQLQQLQEKLSLTLATLNEKQQQLQKSVLEIEQIEKANFQRLASTYEKMDAAQAGKIMLNMATGSQLQDVVKILYYMNDRSAGKLLGEMANTRPEVAAVVSVQLKRIKEAN